MKQLVLIIIVLFVVAVIIVTNLPPKAITLDEISRSEAPRFRPEEHDTVIVTPVNNQIKVSQDKPVEENDKLKETPVNITVSVRKDEAAVDYYLIVQSFRKLEQAQEKATKLKKAFSTEFIVLPPTPEGYYRISCGKYSSKEEARSRLKSIRDLMGTDVWVLSVKR
jgi:hypothetical protein